MVSLAAVAAVLMPIPSLLASICFCDTEGPLEKEAARPLASPG